MERYDERFEHDPKQAPLNWAGGKWFLVRDYSKLDKFADAVKSFIAGGGAGMLSKTVVAPAERLKVLLQTERLLKGTTTPVLQLARQVYKKEGIWAFWRGNYANCIRIVPNKGILFLCNDTYVKWLSKPGEKLSDFRRLIAGSLSGGTLITCTYPLEISFTVLASSTKQQYTGMLHCLSSIFKREGLIGLYRGYWASLMGIVPYTGAQFLFYEKLTSLVRDEKGQTTVINKLMCGATAGCAAQAITYPTDTIRRRLQVQSKLPIHGFTPPTALTTPATDSPITTSTTSTTTAVPKKNVIIKKYNGTWDCIRKIFKEEGYRGFYRGLYINCLRAIPSQAVQFATYSWLKEVLGVGS